MFVCGHFVWRLFTSGHRQLIYLHSNVCVWTFCLKVVHEWACHASFFFPHAYIFHSAPNTRLDFSIFLSQLWLCVDVWVSDCRWQCRSWCCSSASCVFFFPSICILLLIQGLISPSFSRSYLRYGYVWTLGHRLPMTVPILMLCLCFFIPPPPSEFSFCSR